MTPSWIPGGARKRAEKLVLVFRRFSERSFRGWQNAFLRETRVSFAALVLISALWAVLPCQAIDSNRNELAKKARSILSENCFACHGPDKSKRKEGLRLDTEDGLRESGILQPDDRGVIPLVERLFSDDPEFVMPPPEEVRRPSKEELQTLKDWIDAGAPYESHWAFQPIREAVPPKVEDPQGWIRTPVDAFILDRLQKEGVAPSAPASKETLIRRVTLDLTGLPPSLSEIDAFVSDDSPDAYEKVVDRLLASPAYGERMANDWLDLARFADTYGYQNDRESRVWPWRDWLIRAFNENLPYDDFLTWQLAGDLLPNKNQDTILATAFNRLHRQTNEGGSVLEEFRVEYVSDRTQTFGTVFLGMTLGCAKCHDHKFDPISQKDYYELTAFFANIDESGMYSHFTDAIPSPSLILYSTGEREKHEDLKERIRSREESVRKVSKESRVPYSEWLANEYRPMPSTQPVVDLGLDEILGASLEDRANPDRYAVAPSDAGLVEGMKGKAVRFSGDKSVSIPQGGQFERTDPFSFSLWVKQAETRPREVVFHRSKAAEDAGSRGYELLLEEGKPSFALIHFWPGNAIRVRAVEAIEPGRWTHLAVTYDGSSRADGVRLFVNGEPVEVEIVRDRLYRTIRYGDPSQDPPLSLGARFRDSGLKDGLIDEFKVFDREISSLEVESLWRGQGLPHVIGRSLERRAESGEEDARLYEYYLKTLDGPYDQALKQVRQARVDEEAFVKSLREIMVMEEMPEARPTYFLKRGQYNKRGKPVHANTPENILPFPDDLPRNRLGLAKWLLHPDNPLTSRVEVNRIWQMFFGKGLVKTPEDFGNQGSPPTHPELLDYLARRFMSEGWDIKALCKLIVMSSVYRQDSAPRRDLLEKDPGNDLLARGPHHRLSAEQIRDSALAASGLLVMKLGGPSVKPYQPEGLWRDSSSVSYTPDTGESLYRRSLYTFIKRTVPPPMMVTFDAPNREVCVARREITSTPLQALVILNDPQFVEAARALAAVALDSEPATEDRIDRIFRTLTSRHPDEKELQILEEAHREQLDYFRTHPDEAEAYVQVGESPVPGDIDRVELAALTAVAQLSMNFEEFQVKQ